MNHHIINYLLFRQKVVRPALHRISSIDAGKHAGTPVRNIYGGIARDVHLQSPSLLVIFRRFAFMGYHGQPRRGSLGGTQPGE